MTSGRTKETFLYGYAPLSVITDRVERATFDWNIIVALSKGVVYYNRRDIFEWALQQQNKYIILFGICNVAAEEGRVDVLNKVWNAIEFEDWDEDKVDIFEGVGNNATYHGQLNVLKWYDTKGFNICKDWCAQKAAYRGHLHIIQWLREEKGVELKSELYNSAIYNGHLHVMKWLREQGCSWEVRAFKYAAIEGDLDVLQWLHDEGCPWPEDNDVDRVHESLLKPEVQDWCRVNGYREDRIFFRGH